MNFGIKGRSSQVRNMLAFINKAACTNLSVLIEGESGTGKELIANAVHEASERRGKPFISVNCASLPHDLFENELFGHEPGAFSGASSAKPGLFELADNGTLFIDEVGEMKPNLQVKFLRVLETGTFMRLGGVKSISANVRVVAATNRVLETEIDRGNFRTDLYYRLCVLRVFLPPLRERKEDIPDLVEHFLKSAKCGKQFTAEALGLLSKYDWPGNVRELKNLVDRLGVLIDADTIDAGCVDTELKSRPRQERAEGLSMEGHSFDSFIESAEKEFLKRALLKYGDDKSEMAQVLKISRDKLYRKLKQYGLQG